MLPRLIAVARTPSLQRAADVLLAAALFAGSVADIAAHTRNSGWGGPLPLELLAAAAISVPLIWRREHPVLALTLAFAGGATNVLLVGDRQGAFEPFVALVVAFYSVGAHMERRRSLQTLVVALCVALVPAALLHKAPGSAAPLLVWTFAAWLIGRIIRSWRGRALALEQANRLLEEQRDLQADAAVAVERGRIARELHDVIAHNVSMMVVQAGAAARVLEGDQPHVRAALEAIETTGRDTVDEMRRLLGVLRSDDEAALAPQPGLADLERLVESMREAGLPVELTVEGAPIELPAVLDLTAYRIAQEALTNALKHAGAAPTHLTLRYADASLEIEVQDEGSAAAPRGSGTGHGLVGMRERVRLYGGRLDAGRRNGGWTVHASLPLGEAR